VISLYHFPDHDVIIYPNPVKKNQPVQIITSKAGRKTVQVLNSNGVLIQELHLKELKQQIQTLQLSNGLYFIRIIDGEDHSVYTQKLIVY
jgi:predicted Fe-Mo cluster-binding NifX family protein